MMKLYYMSGACPLADHIVLEWIGEPYTAQQLTHDELKGADYLKINPAGAVPALEVDGEVITQNTAILNYLADRFPEAKLGGDGSTIGRARVNQWLGIVNADMHPTFKPLFGATAYLQDDDIIAQTKANAKAVLRSAFERVNAQLDGQDWVVGTRSIVDPYLYVLLRWAKGMQIDLAGLDNLTTFIERMEADEGVRRALIDEGLAS